MANKKIFYQTTNKSFAPISQLLTQRLLIAYSILFDCYWCPEYTDK